MQVVLKTGGLDIAPRKAAIDLSTYTRSLSACGVSFESLDADEIMRRWPQWRPDRRASRHLSGRERDRDGRARQRRAPAHGPLRTGRRYWIALQWTVFGSVADDVEVTAGGETYRCQSLVVAAGPWTARVLQLSAGCRSLWRSPESK